MPPYRLLLHARIEKELAKIPRDYASRLVEAMRHLREEPRPRQAVHLGQEFYRLRVGDYRIVYAVFEAEQTVFVGKVARRSEQTYRDLDSLREAARHSLDIDDE